MLLPTTSILALWATLATSASIPSLARRQDPSNAPADIHFPFDNVTLKNARVGESYGAKVAGFVIGQGSASTIFAKVSGEDWVQVSPDGVISGTPPVGASDSDTEVTVRATSASKSSATLKIAITVRRADEVLLEQLGVLSFNLWEGGVNVNNYHEKQLRFILESGADVVSVQESVYGGHAARIANGLGWDVWVSDHSASILSKYPILQRYEKTFAGLGARINLNGNSTSKKEINFWAAHPTAWPYGVYGFCRDHKTTDEVFQIEAQSGRTGQMAEIMKAMAPQIADSANVPVLLAGDMNAPSHLDWVEGLREKNCGVAKFGWPTSVLPQEHGLIDSFRVAHPDPVAVQGTTWSPLYPRSEGETGEPEPQDRIDFVYGTKELGVVRSERVMAGKPKPRPNEVDNEWTSDHAAMLTWYRLP